MLTLWGLSVSWQLLMTAIGVVATTVWGLSYVVLKAAGRLPEGATFDQFAEYSVGLAAIGIVFIGIPVLVIGLAVSFALNG